MANKKSALVLSVAQLKDGYSKTMDNAMRFFGAASNLFREYPEKALAIAEIGQEELGRSLTLLSAFALPQSPKSWEWFWKGWRDHLVKAHRAYIYEIFSPLRIEVDDKASGRKFSGPTLRAKIPHEKEAGFYIDFDETSGKFLSPSDEISTFESAGRTVTLMYLFATADAVRRVLFHRDEDFRLAAFGELAFRVCSENIYQQDMPAIMQEFRSRSQEHDALVADMETAFKGNQQFFENLRPASIQSSVITPSAETNP